MRQIDFITIGDLILYGLPLVAILGMLIPLVIGMSNLSLLSLYLAVPMIVSPILYLKYCKDL